MPSRITQLPGDLGNVKRSDVWGKQTPQQARERETVNVFPTEKPGSFNHLRMAFA